MNSLNLIPCKKLQFQKVTVTATARLHMGFIDLNGSKGRMFGSLGLALNAPKTRLTVTGGKEALNVANSDDHVAKVIKNIKKRLNIEEVISIEIHEKIPEHAGLGSGTQLALAIGAGINALFGLNLTTAQLAALTSRGHRSGIGIGTFEQGGFVLDGGRNMLQNNTQKSIRQVPPIIARHDFPEEWPILLVMDNADQGVFGDAEVQAFAALTHADLATAQALSHSVLMQALPAIIERDYTQFSQAIHALQLATGAYFSTAQGGHYKSARVAEVLGYLNAQGVVCAGQSSWGPTGFAIFESDDIANEMLIQLQRAFSTTSQLRFELMRAKNTGASIQLS